MNGQSQVLALVMALLAPVSGFGSNWVKFPVTSVEGSSYFLDTDSLVKKGPFVRLWERLILKKPSENPSLGPFQSALFYMSYDCGHKSAALLETRFYKDSDSRDQIAHRIHTHPKYMYVAPDSPPEMKLNEVCKLVKGPRHP